MMLWRLNLTVTCILSIVVHCGLSKRTNLERKYCLERRSDKYLNSFLWKIERTPPIYLFGTIHVRYDFVWNHIPKNMKYAFRTSSRLVTELNLGNATTVDAIRKCRLLPGSQTLRDIIPNSLYVRLKMHLDYVRRKLASWLPEQWRNQLIAANIYQLLTRNWERKKVIWIVVLLMNDLTPIGVNSNQKLALDLYLGSRASKKKMKMEGLETAADQCDPFNNLDHDRAVFLLNYTLHIQELIRAGKIKPQYHYQQRSMVEHYKCGNLPSVLKDMGNFRSTVNVTSLMTQEQRRKIMDIDKYFIEELLYKRNIKMADRIEKIIQNPKDKRVFIALGVGHFFGNKSVIDLLRRKGHSVRHIKPDERLPEQALARQLRKKRRERKKPYGLGQDLLQKLAKHIEDVQTLWVRMNRSTEDVIKHNKERWPLPTAPPSQVRIIQTFQKEKTYVYYYSNHAIQASPNVVLLIGTLLSAFWSLR